MNKLWKSLCRLLTSCKGKNMDKDINNCNPFKQIGM